MTTTPHPLQPFLRQGPERFDLSETHFAAPAPPRGPVHHDAVRWQGLWENPSDSLAIVGRRHVAALTLAGVPVRIGQHYRPHAPLDDDLAPEAKPFLPLVSTEMKRCAVTVHHLLPDEGRVRQCLYPGRSFEFEPELVERTHPTLVAMTVFERDRLPGGMTRLLARFGQVWVPCERNRAVLRTAGVERVAVVPHPYDPTTEVVLRRLGQERRARRAANPRAPVTFGAIGKWEARKNHHALIGAFLRAFGPETPARLAIKTSAYADYAGYPKDALASVTEHLRDPEVAGRGWTLAKAFRSIRVHTGILPQAQVLEMFGQLDVYVSAAHAEGFDLPAQDALLAGCRLIHVGYGGSEDFAPSSALRLWQEGDATEPCHPGYGWGKAQWAVVDQARLVAAMQQAFEEARAGAGAPADGGSGQPALAAHAPLAVGATMRAELEALARRNGLDDLSWNEVTL